MVSAAAGAMTAPMWFTSVVPLSIVLPIVDDSTLMFVFWFVNNIAAPPVVVNVVVVVNVALKRKKKLFPLINKIMN